LPGHFWSQRVRQAYDELARPWRLVTFLAALPGIAWAIYRKRWLALGATAVGSIALAELGRRRERGASVFPSSAALLAPVWIGERAVCSWIAVGARLSGGCHYGNGRIVIAANSACVLRRRVSARCADAAVPA
jgi:hypothetical protein